MVAAGAGRVTHICSYHAQMFGFAHPFVSCTTARTCRFSVCYAFFIHYQSIEIFKDSGNNKIKGIDFLYSNFV